jgi:glycosyltransferase involved in cell wall biosynthesis
VERQVGIGSAARAIEPHIRARPGVTWVDITYWKGGGLIERLPLGRAGAVVRGFLQARGALRRAQFDALFFLTHNPAVFHQRYLQRTPTLLWTDVTPLQLDAQAHLYGHATTGASTAQTVKHGLVRRTFHRAAMCIGWSEWARASFSRDYGVPDSRTAVVAPGVDLSEWTLPSSRRAYGGPPRLLFVGGDFVRKGGDLLLDVFRAHFRGRCELDLVTRDAVPGEPGVRVHRGLTTGSPQLRQLYADADAFVLPTRGDCFSIATIEAMATGLPVVVSGIAGIPEIVAPQKSGYLVAPGDGASLRTALEAVVADPAHGRAMGVYGRELVERHFDSSKTAARIMDLLAVAAGRQVRAAS